MARFEVNWLFAANSFGEPKVIGSLLDVLDPQGFVVSIEDTPPVLLENVTKHCVASIR